MDACAILERLENIGVQIIVAGDKLQLRPGSAVPPELFSEVKAHKPELVTILKLRGYQFKHSEFEAPDKELDEIAAGVNRDRYVLLWSTVLEDLIAFYKDEVDRVNIPPGFVPYSLRELKELFSEVSKVGPDELRIIHEAKRQGGVVRDRRNSTVICLNCGFSSWWQRADGELICQRCHPKPEQ